MINKHFVYQSEILKYLISKLIIGKEKMRTQNPNLNTQIQVKKLDEQKQKELEEILRKVFVFAIDNAEKIDPNMRYLLIFGCAVIEESTKGNYHKAYEYLKDLKYNLEKLAEKESVYLQEEEENEFW